MPQESEPVIPWRVGSKVKFNVYSGPNPEDIVCMCRTPELAALIVSSVNVYLGIPEE